MSVTFVIGRAGSGKTFRCFSAIVQALRADSLGPPIYWLLPRQATFTAERELTCASGLPGFCRARVVSFEQLGQDVFDHCGGSAIPQVSDIGRQMILGHLLRELAPRLGYFASVARQAGLALELDRTFAEFERAGKTTADLATLIDDLQNTGALDEEAIALQAKLRDLRLLYDAYTSYLGQDRLDQPRRLEQVLASVEQCSFLRQATFYVDGFTEFSSFERRMLAATAKAGARMEITLLMDPRSPLLRNPHLLPDEMGLFHRTQSTYRKLWFAFTQAAVAVGEPVLLEGAHRFKTDALNRLAREFDAPCELLPPENRLQSDSVMASLERIEAPDREREADAIAREIRLLLAQGYRLRDIVVLARNLEPYQELIATIFDEHDIPYFIDRRRPASHHPLLEFLRSALRVARFDWPHTPVMALLKTGLAGVTPDEADELENYVLLHRVSGPAWESSQRWTYRRRLTLGEDATAPQAPDPDQIDAIRRRVSDRLMPFVHAIREGKPQTVRAQVTQVFELFDRFAVRQTLSQWMAESATGAAGAASPLEQRGEHEQVWAELVKLFEQLVDLLGDQQLTPGEFAEVLDSGLEGLDLALTPPTLDQVLVGEVDRTICPPVRAAFVMGLNEGEFPAVPRDQTVLSDRERRELVRRQVELDPDGGRRLLDEPLLGYLAFTRASEKLVLSRSISDDHGRTASPSPFWRRLGELFAELGTTSIPARGGGHIEGISTPRQLVAAAMRWVREGAVSASNAEGPALYQWLASHQGADGPIGHLLAQAWPALRYANTSTLSDAPAGSLFRAPLSATLSQLETFAACPFRHFMRYGLKLESRRESDVSLRDLSQVYHGVLEDLFNRVIESDTRAAEDPLPITEQMIRDATHKAGQALRGELMLSTARNRYLLHWVERTLLQFVESQRELLKRSRFRPRAAGVAFGEGARAPAMKFDTPAGAQVSVSGRIDRIDTLPESGDAIVLDYRLGVGALSLSKVYYGLSLQLLGHLLALQTLGARPGGPSLNPTGGFYLQLLRPLGDVSHPDEAADPSDAKYLLALKPRGVFAGCSFADLDSQAADGRSLAIAAFIKKDGGFGMRNTTDVAEGQELPALLSRVRGHIGALADQILAGNVSVFPYRLNQESPCPRCEFRGVCRFETTVNRYHILPSMGREQVLDTLRKEAGGE